MGLSLKSTLLGSKIRILFSVVLVLGVVVAGGVSLGVLGAPGVGGIDNSFGNVTENTTEIRTDITVSNPNPVGISLGGVSVSYDVTMNDVAMANGTKEGVSVGTGNSTVELTTLMANDRIPAWWVSHVRNGERTTLRVDASVRSATLGRSFDAPPVTRRISTDLVSQFNSTEPRPVNASQPLVSDPVAYVNETSARWGEVTSSETPIALRFEVYNAKTLPMVITEIGYDITMNDIEVGSGASRTGHVIEGHTTETIDTRTVIRNAKLDEWWVSHLKNDQVTELRIDFYARVELAGETFRIPLDELTYTKTVETDILGSKGESTDGGESNDATTTGSDGSETSDGSGATTEESTATTTEKATTDETATTDGGSATDESTTTTGESTTGDETTTDDGLFARDPSGVR
ncbi:LEA type 2 family protein [Halorussus sp. AFM4]|uniref:LEA type 2 family protein n=1 Tax=Halorussus sp. AFM4 TaxID=3421651 RepID=UPI003EBA272B